MTPSRGSSSSFAARAKRVCRRRRLGDFYFFGASRPSAICGGGHRPCRGSRPSSPPRHLRIFASSASAPTTFSHHDRPAAAAAADDCRGRTVAAVSRFRDSRVYIVTAARRGTVAKRAVSVKRSPLRLDIVSLVPSAIMRCGRDGTSGRARLQQRLIGGTATAAESRCSAAADAPAAQDGGRRRRRGSQQRRVLL